MKRMTKKIMSSAVIMTFICGVLLLGVGNSWAAKDTIELKFATHYPPTHVLTKVDKQWCKKIEKETNGRVKLRMFTGGSLLSPAKAWYELSQGAADIANVSVAMAQGFDIANNLGSFHYGSDVTTLRKLLPKVMDKFPEFREEFKANKVLVFSGAVPEYVTCSRKKPLRTVEDFKGLQMKPPAAINGLIEKLGAVSVRIPFVETYNSLDKGMIDAAVIPVELMKGFRVAEVTKYHTKMHLPAYAPGSLRAMNWDSWNRLPADIQKIFEASFHWYEDAMLNAKLETNDTGYEFAKKLGDEIIEMAPEEYEKLYAIMDELGKETAVKIDKAGKPGTAIYNYMRQLIEEEKANK